MSLALKVCVALLSPFRLSTINAWAWFCELPEVTLNTIFDNINQGQKTPRV